MLLFLDFDGVLHPTSGGGLFNQACIALIEEFLRTYPQMNVVVTSTWREHRTIDELKKLTGDYIGERIIDVTPMIDEPFLKYVRYHEVKRYLMQNDKVDMPWVALDDALGNYPPNKPVVFTNEKTGVTQNDIVKLKVFIESSQE